MALTLRTPYSPAIAWLGRIDAWVQRIAERISTDEESVTTISLEIDGMENLASRYGVAAADHVSRIMLRLLKEETRIEDLVYRKGAGVFEVVMVDCPESDADSILAKVERSFRQAVFDAGYSSQI